MKRNHHSREHRTQELLRLVQEAEHYKKEVRSIVRDLSDQYQRNVISQAIYRSKVKDAFGQHTPLALLRHYDDCIKRYRQELRVVHQQETSERLSRVHLFVFFGIMLSLGIFFSIQPFLTGFFSATSIKQEIPLMVTTAQNSVYSFSLPAGEIQSLAISGTLEGDGAAQVYLGDKSQLIYDSNQQRKKKGFLSALTGFLSASFNQTEEQTFIVTDENGATVSHELAHDKKIATFTFPASYFPELAFDDLVGNNLRISTTARGVVEPEYVTFTKNYAVDASNITFQRGTIAVRATGTILYQCRIWDFNVGVCLSGWQYLKTVVANEEYIVSFEPGIIALAEGNIREGASLEDDLFFPLEALDIAANNFQLGDVVKFDILVKNLAMAAVYNATIHLVLVDTYNNTLADISSVDVAFEPGKLGAFKLYWDTESIVPGIYSGTLLLAANGKTEEKTIRMQITAKKITTSIIDITGKAITDVDYRHPLRFFSEACVDTCRLNNFTRNNSTLIISVRDAILNITSIIYELKSSGNQSGQENNLTSNVSAIPLRRGKILINTTKITYRDEAKKQHKLKRYALDNKKDYGENWEKTCDGNRCVHALYTYDKYYEKSDGEFDAIENALTQEACSAGDEICILTKEHRIDFKQKASDPETVTITKQHYAVSFEPLQLRALLNAASVILSSANPVSGLGEDNTYTYTHAFGEQIDLRFTYTPDTLKEEVIFSDPFFLDKANITNATGFISLDYAVLTPSGALWYTGDGIPVVFTEGEEVAAIALQLRDADGKHIFTLPQPVAYAGNQSLDLDYVLTKTINKTIISIQTPLAFFREQSYPIIIDPTVLLTDTNIAFDGHVKFFPSDGGYTRVGTAASFSVGTSTTGAACQPATANTCKFRGDMDWDITSIPDNAELVDINLTLRVPVLGLPDTTMFFYHMNGNSTTYANTGAGNAGFFADMANGTNYFNQTVTGTGFTYFNITRPQLLADLHSILLSRSNSWSFGIKSNETGPTGANATEFDSEETTTAANRPRITFTYNLPPPSIILNTPANNSRFAEFINITLNATVYDNEPRIREAVFYGSDNNPPSGKEVIALFSNISNSSVLRYNWTTAVQREDVNTVLLLHFDNRSEFGENRTKVVDFSNVSNNGTLVGAGVSNIGFNATGGKLGGTFRFNSSTTGNNRNITFGDKDVLLGTAYTYMMWVRPTNTSKNGTIMNKYDSALSQGLQIQLGANGDLIVTTDSTTTRVASFFTENVYQHLALTVSSGNELVIYRDGVQKSTATIAGLSDNNVPFDLAIEIEPNANSFVGFIDELVILNKTLTVSELTDRFRLKGNVYYWFVNATDASQPANGSNMSEIRMFTVSMKPNITQVSITPSPSANTTDTLNCTFTVADVNSRETLTANVTFYNNSAFFQSFVATVTNGTQAGQALAAGAPARGETWHCGVTPSDNIQQGDQKNSSTISIVNSVPSLPVLAGPPDLFATTNVNPRFNWTSSVDADDDAINYTLNLTCYSTSGGGCTAPGDNRLENVTTNATTIANNLKFKIDDGFYYNWTVRAMDGTNQSSYAQPRTFNITVLVAIALTTNTVNFQSLGIGQTNDTSDGAPAPFTIQNQGNSFIEINISAIGTDLFTQSAIPSNAFQFKARNTVPPEGTGQIINTTRSIITYTNVARTNQTVLAGFNYTSPASSVDIDINVTVPADESSGAKGTSLLLTGYYIGGLT